MMQRIFASVILPLLSVATVGFAQEPARPTTEPTTRPTTQVTAAVVPPAEFAAMIGRQDHVLLNVRTPQEYATSHLAGATLIDFHSPDFEQQIRGLPRDKTYLIYCRSGRRSHLACIQMQRLGFTRTIDLQGGIHAWQAAGQSVETGKN